MSKLIISVSGLRGVVGETLTPQVAIDYAAAFVPHLPPGPLILSRDGRATGPLLADAVRAAICGMGRDVLDAQVAATPTTGRLVRQHQAAGGMQISASHNPAPYNGIKLFGPDGQVVSAELGQRVLEGYQRGDHDWQAYDRIGHAEVLDDTVSDHLAAVLRLVAADRIRAQGFSVLLDANHGAGGVSGAPLLKELGCDLALVGGQPHGRFAHPPEPTADHLSGIAALVGSASFAVGFCQDPDADRLALIDEHGRYVGEEYTLAVCLRHILSSRQGPVVTNCSTSRMAEDLARAAGVPFFRSAVGEANVAQLMRQEKAVFGGEGNGGPIDPQVGYVRDSFVGMALVLDALAATGKPLSQLVDELPRYAIHKAKVDLESGQVAAALPRLEAHFSGAAASHLDGLRLDWPDKWLLVRASNTEPIVRIVAEAPSEDEARRLCDETARVMRR